MFTIIERLRQTIKYNVLLYTAKCIRFSSSLWFCSPLVVQQLQIKFFLHAVDPLSQEKEVHLDLPVNVGQLVHQGNQDLKDQKEIKANKGKVTRGGM